MECPDLKNFSGFIFKRVLSSNNEVKRVCVEGRLNRDDDEHKVVAILEKEAFQEETLSALLTDRSALTEEFRNDIYGNFSCLPDPVLNAVKVKLIYPATDMHIRKHTSSPCHLIEETPTLHHTVILPYLQKKGTFSIDWVTNILEGKKEVDRVIYRNEDPLNGFILLPDMKWNGKIVEDLYVVAIVRRNDITSLRDLTDDHIPLLKNILQEGSRVIEQKYGLPISQQRVFIHYPPSYYHLHVHFTSLRYHAHVERSHLVSSVLQMLEMDPTFFQKASLPFTLFESDPLFAIIRDSEGIQVAEKMN